MRYNKLGSGWKISALSFGTGRLPTQGSNKYVLDEIASAKLIDEAIDRGINYFDTAYIYNLGMCENFLGRTITGVKRQKVRIATKMPVSIIESRKSMDAVLNKQLKRLKTDHIDFYLFHSLNRVSWEHLKKLEPIEWAEKAKAAGKIGEIGFSFHDEFAVFQDIISYYDKWGLCYIQFNYLDENSQAGVRGLELAYELGVPVIVMEPLKGGQLAKFPTESVQNIWNEFSGDKDHVDLALQWIWDHKQVSSLMSGISKQSDLEQNLAAANFAVPNSLTVSERDVINRVKSELNKLSIIPCTKCNYCMPCPNGVYISGIFQFYNELILHNNIKNKNPEYQFFPDELRANNCLSCGKCEMVCPQGIKIMKWLKEIHCKLS